MMCYPWPNIETQNPIKFLLNREYSDSTNTRRKILTSCLNGAKSLYNKDLSAHFGCVNAIEFSNGGELLASGGDDRRVLLWNVEEALQGVNRPISMRAQHLSNIFCLGYDSKNSKIFSAGNDDQVIVHDTTTGDPVDYFLHEQPVYSVSIDPFNDFVFASACDDGRILVYDIRQPSSSDPLELSVCGSAYHGVMFNPIDSSLIATANAKDGAALWDARKPKQSLVRYGSAESCMSVRWDGQGLNLLALRRRLPPVLYPINSPNYLVQFDHPSYYNSCTMKSCCFAGEDDQFVLSGSDDFNLYMWKVPKCEPGTWVSSAHMIITGHRSIVNQVRFNYQNNLIASSGVEKIIKVWSPFLLPSNRGGTESSFNQRKVFSHQEYINLVLSSGQFISHDYSHQSTKEDPRMMAFFDSLVQREIEGWTSEDSHSLPLSPLASDHAVSDDLSSSSDSENNEGNQTGKNISKKSASNPIIEMIARKRSQLQLLANKSQDKHKSSDSSDSGTEINRNCRHKHLSKRCRKRALSSSDSLVSSSSEKNTKLMSSEDLDISRVTDNKEKESTENPSTSSETPDSGVTISERPVGKKFRSRPHRNYRCHQPDSDSN